MKFLFLALATLLISQTLLAFDHSHAKFAEILSASVVKKGPLSQVNYEWFKQNPKKLEAYLKDLEAVKLGHIQKWSKDQKIAFFINAYNAYTIKLVMSEYPVDSIKDIGGFFASPWKMGFFNLIDKVHSLDQIEHEYLRFKYKEPRIHFAIVCASISCPGLSDKPYLAAFLDDQLNAAKIEFLKDTSRNRYDAKTKTLYLSKIFDWFAVDFVKAAGPIKAYVADSIGTSPEESREILSAQVKIEYLDYDWSLNKVK
ncbi:MAG: DUF547 domain-containing protein [SAR324 cluster bacterium]|nr:DUF547 domain-containing protein [SAR324 cluster bacterium]